MIHKSKRPVGLDKKDLNPITTSLIIAVVFVITRIMYKIILDKLTYSLTVMDKPIGIRVFHRKQKDEIQGSHLTRSLRDKLTRAQQQKQEIYQVYSDVMFSITQGKFNLLDFEQIQPLCQEGILLGQIDLNVPEDVNNARELMTRILQDQQIEPKERYHIILCVSEATTNVIKHAKYGSLVIRKVRGYLRVCISDRGPGMNLEKLPKFIFLHGYSTKNSMGAGFGLMYKYAERISLSLLEDGTELVLDFKT